VARGSDYVYFSFALFGIFVASLAQGRDTNLYYAAVAGMVGPKDPAQVQRIIQQVMPWCDVFPQPPAPLTSLSFLYPSKLDGKTCSFLKSADALLEQHNYSAIPDFLTKTQPPLRARLLPTPYEMVTNNLYSNFKLALESLYYMNLPATSKDTDTFDRQLDTAIFKYLLSIIWPFILGFAVALRMTRTTADVTEWPI
jgi:hypothetical protein